MFVKTGDKVKVIAGKDKGKEGTVLSVNAKTNRIVVKGVNKIKKHEKPSQTNANGGVVEKGHDPVTAAGFHKFSDQIPFGGGVERIKLIESAGVIK